MGLIEQFLFNKNHRERFHQIFVAVVLRQKTEKIIGFKVRWEVFSHLTMKVFRDLNVEVHLNCTHYSPGTLFHDVLRHFR